MKDLMVKAWGYVPDKKQVLMITLVVCVILVSIGGVIVGIKIPFKDKTVAEIALESHWENWRLHANTTELMVAKDDKDIKEHECIALRKKLADLRLARWQLMGIQGMNPQKKAVEVDMATTELDDAKKKLILAESSLLGATRLFDELVAQR